MACAQITCGCHALQALSQRDIPALQQKVADQEAAVAAAAERQEVAHTEAAEAQHALQVQLVLLCVVSSLRCMSMSQKHGVLLQLITG